MQNNNINVLGKVVSKGKGLQINLDIAKLHTRTNIEVPVIIQRGKIDGPTILITGGIHGDEINGVEIVRQIIKKGYNKPEKGTVICIPVVNVFGFLGQSRKFPDGRDLNRVFPGSKTGPLASRFAWHIMTEIIPHVDYCIDYHTGGGDRFNVPQIRIPKNDELIELANIFGAPFIVESKNISKSFRDACIRKGKKVLLYEGGKSHALDANVTAVGVRGALRIMQHLGFRDFTEELNNFPNPVKLTQKNSIYIKDSVWIRAKYSGMYHPNINIGDFIQKGDIVGSISDPFGDFEKFVKAPHNGYVICSTEAPIVNQGDALIHMSKV